MAENDVTKILFIDHDETAFQFRKCMAKVLGALPPVELFHATDATEALQLLEQLHPDVVVIDDESREECDLFLDSLGGNHPPIVMQTEEAQRGKQARVTQGNKEVTLVQREETLEDIHHTLLVATSVAFRDTFDTTKLPS